MLVFFWSFAVIAVIVSGTYRLIVNIDDYCLSIIHPMRNERKDRQSSVRWHLLSLYISAISYRPMYEECVVF